MWKKKEILLHDNETALARNAERLAIVVLVLVVVVSAVMGRRLKEEVTIIPLNKQDYEFIIKDLRGKNKILSDSILGMRIDARNQLEQCWEANK
jgi:hypothetical protein